MGQPDAPAEDGSSRRRVSANVFALGVVSMVTDTSSEMVTAVLPLYFVLTLGMSPLQFGFLIGLYGGVTSIVQLAAGHAADRWQRRKSIAGAGYALAAVCKLGLIAVGRSVPGIGLVLALDRTGKGLRTAPRDALISLSSHQEDLGRSFGVHRAFDTAGAFLGPLLACVILSQGSSGFNAIPLYHEVFMVSFCIALVGVALLVVAVRDRRSPIVDSRAVSVRAALRLLTSWRFRALTVTAILFSFVQISDAFIYLLLLRRYDFALAWFPLLSLGSALGFMIMAIPLGRLADRLGRARVFLAGQALLLVVYLLIAHAPESQPCLVAILAVHGVFYAATSGVLMAQAGPLIPEHLRTSGMALIQTGVALANLASAALFGLAWTVWGPAAAVNVFTGALIASLLLGVGLLPVRERDTTRVLTA